MADFKHAKKGSYVTALSADKEKQFQKWVTDNDVPWQDVPTADYDMRGYYKALQSGDPNAKQELNDSDGRMHFPDTYKTPYHKSFSRESQYADQDAPYWKNDYQLVDHKGDLLLDERSESWLNSLINSWLPKEDE